MTEEQRIAADLKQELALLQASATNQHLLLREVASILNTVSSTLTSANQISAHEREALIARLEALEGELVHQRRTLADTLNRLERTVDTLGHEFDSLAADRDEADANLLEIVRRTDSIIAHIQSVGPIAKECLSHARELVNRDPETGHRLSTIDRVIKGLSVAFWGAVATAAVLLSLSRLMPYLLPK